MSSKRLITSTSVLDEAESLWWEKFSDVEEKFCWVQPPEVNTFLRKKYLNKIINLLPNEGTVLELGCGSGWLCLQLGRLRVNHVVGMDFSEEQISKAKTRARESNLQHKIEFKKQTADELKNSKNAFDIVIVHAFLHHLSVEEIKEVFSAAHRLMKSGGRLVLFEPIQYPAQGEDTKTRVIRKFAQKLITGLSSSTFLNFCKRSSSELKVRGLLEERNVGVPPFGASPKEIPFQPDELENLIAPFFTIREKFRCLAFSYFVAQENLLMELSYPRFARLVRWPLLTGARFVEQQLLSLKSPPPDFWIFEMFICDLK